MSRDRKKMVCLAVAAASIVFIEYIPSLKDGFINWDDNLYVYENPDIRALSLAFLRHAFTSYAAFNWHPLTIISYAIDYRLMGMSPFIYHLTNIVFHAANTFLVAVLVFRLVEIAAPAWAGSYSMPQGPSPAIAASFVTALLFGLHPLHVESVSWVSERKDVLYSFFFLLSALAYLEYVSSSAWGKYRNYSLSLLFFALSVISKPMAVSLPAVFLILDHYPLNRFDGVRKIFFNAGPLLLEKAPFFALSLLSGILTIEAQKSSIAPMEAVGFVTHVLVAAHACIFYLYKMVYPVGLAPFYPYPKHMRVPGGEYIVSFLLFIAISLIVLLVSKKHRVYVSVWLYYLITLLPVIGLVQVGSQAAADRYTYLPSLGPFMLAGIGVGYFFSKPGGEMRGKADAYALKNKFAPVAVVIAGTALAFFSFFTLTQEAVWKDSMTLWNYELSEFPNAYVAYHNRGIVYMDLHDYPRAIENLNMAISLNPNYSMLSYYSRGKLYQMEGDYLMALKDFNVAAALSPKFSKPHNDLGISYGNLKQYDKAILEFNKAIGLDPSFEEAYNNRGYTYLKMGEYGKAIKDISKALDIDPMNSGAYYNLGSAYSLAGNAEKAEFYFKKASGLSAKARSVSAQVNHDYDTSTKKR